MVHLKACTLSCSLVDPRKNDQKRVIKDHSSSHFHGDTWNRMDSGYISKTGLLWSFWSFPDRCSLAPIPSLPSTIHSSATHLRSKHSIHYLCGYIEVIAEEIHQGSSLRWSGGNFPTTRAPLKKWLSCRLPRPTAYSADTLITFVYFSHILSRSNEG